MSCCQPLDEPEILASRLEEQALLAASSNLEHGRIRTDFVVPSVHCASCIRAIEDGLSRLAGVEDVRVNLSQKRVSVTWQKAACRASDISRALTALGFEHSPDDPESAGNAADATGRHLLFCLGITGFAAANIMLLSVSVWSGANDVTGQLLHLVSGLIAAPAVIFGGRPFFGSAATALRTGRLNMDVPISLAVLLAFAMSLFESLTGGEDVYFDASVTLLFFLLIGRYLDHRMRDRARGAVSRLAGMSAKGAAQIDGRGELRYLRREEIQPGMILRIFPGERFPVDARILRGASDVDRALVTGEVTPVAVEAGSEVESGTLNLTGSVDVTVLRGAQNSYLADILQMMDAAENGRGQYRRIADRMAAIYAPAVHLLALVAFVGWLLHTGGDWHQALFTAIAVLIVTCPCALGLAVPVVHVAAAARLFQNGILMKDGSALERLAEADRIVFDKTGTLTTGKPGVIEAAFADPGEAAIARALAMRSSHPASVALGEYIATRPATGEQLREVPGFGVEGSFGARQARLGRAGWVSEIASEAAKDAGISFAVEGHKPVAIHLVETIRPDAVNVVEALRRSGVTMEIVSGDHAGAVASVASQLEIPKTTHDATPAQKIARLEELKRAGHRAVMVGDGLNDAPALAASHVSFAPASASDVGRLAADFVFTRESLDAIPVALRIARRARLLVRQNFALAIAYNCIAVPLALAGMVTPLVAAIAMSASSIVVAANSLRFRSAARDAEALSLSRRPVEPNPLAA